MLHDTVMGMEAHELSFLRKPGSDDEMLPKGLCNAVIISRKGSTFLRRWLETYDGFVERHWTEHSVVSLVLACLAIWWDEDGGEMPNKGARGGRFSRWNDGMRRPQGIHVVRGISLPVVGIRREIELTSRKCLGH